MISNTNLYDRGQEEEPRIDLGLLKERAIKTGNLLIAGNKIIEINNVSAVEKL